MLGDGPQGCSFSLVPLQGGRWEKRGWRRESVPWKAGTSVLVVLLVNSVCAAAFLVVMQKDLLLGEVWVSEGTQCSGDCVSAGDVV